MTTIRATKAIYVTFLVISAVALLAAAGVDVYIEIGNDNGLEIGFGSADDIRPYFWLRGFLVVSFVSAVIALAAYLIDKWTVRRSGS